MKRVLSVLAGHRRRSAPAVAPLIRLGSGIRLIALVCAARFAGPAFALDSWNIDFAGSLPGFLYDVEIAGGHAYCATGSGLLVLEVPAGGIPTQVAFLPLQNVTDVAVENQHAYLTAGEGSADGSLVIVDISDPAAPATIGRFDGLHAPTDLVVRDARVYVADSYRGLSIIDVAVPAAPEEVGILPLSGPLTGLDLVGTLVYLADQGNGLRVIDVSNPAQPVQIGGFNPGHAVQDIVVQGDYAFLACFPGIVVLDVADPAAPAPAGSFTCPEVRHLAWSGAHLYLAYWFSIGILDVQNPSAPFQVSSLGIEGRPWHFAPAGDTVYVAGFYGGLRVIDVQNPASPVEVAAFPLLGDALGVTLRDHRVFLSGGYRVSDEHKRVAGESRRLRARGGAGEAGRTAVGRGRADASRDEPAAGLYVVDLADPSKPAIAAWSEFGNAMDLALGDSLACLTDWNGRLGVFSIAGAGDPEEIGWAPTGYWTTDLAVQGRYAYVLIEYDLLIFDLIDPSAPALVGSIDTGTTAIDVQDGYAYVLDYYWGLFIVDVSDPAAPVVRGSFDMPNWAEGVAVEGDYAYVANGDLGLRIIDVRQPEAPVEVGWCDTPGYAVGVTWSDGRAYVADSEGGVRVFDVTNPSAPAEVGYFVTTVPAENVSVAGDDIVVGCWGGGIFVLKSRIPSGMADDHPGNKPDRPQLDGPNPSNGPAEIRFMLQSERLVRIAVYSAGGNLVAQLLDRRLPAGAHTVAWSGRDQRGRNASSGAYLVRLDVGDHFETRRVTVLR